jgi:6-pyruvoyltetrahydropterin/6-carboxytetrahydropterin synthase
MPLNTTFVASSGFEAARHVDILPDGHRSKQKHGHSFLATIQCSMPSEIAPYPGGELEVMQSRLGMQIAKLDYSDLNVAIDTPTDENLARWVNAHCYVPSTQKIGIQSTSDSGVEIEIHGKAHVWRRYVFHSIRHLNNLPEGHVCGIEHCHSFVLIVHVDQQLGERDICVDYDFIDECWEQVLKKLSFINLNTLPNLGDPSTENLASWIWNELRIVVRDVSRVTIYESPRCGVTFDGLKFHVWNESSFNCGVLKRDTHSKSQSNFVTALQSFLVRIYVSQLVGQETSLNVAAGGARDCLHATLALIDSMVVTHLSDIPDTSTKSIALWIHNKIAEKIPNIDRVELFEIRGCGVVVSSGLVDTVIPL